MKKLNVKDFNIKLNADELATEFPLWGNNFGQVIVSVSEVNINDVDFNQINEKTAFVESNKKEIISNLLLEIFEDRDNQNKTAEDFMKDLTLSTLCIFPEYEYRAELGFDLPEDYFGDHFITGYLEGDNTWDSCTIDG